VYIIKILNHNQKLFFEEEQIIQWPNESKNKRKTMVDKILQRKLHIEHKTCKSLHKQGWRPGWLNELGSWIT
jgi:hypothetical protein